MKGWSLPWRTAGRAGRSAAHTPPLRYDWLTPLYDRVVRWTLPEVAFRTALLDLGRGLTPRRVLDLGCGTGSLTLLAKELHDDAQVVGLDCDQRALDLAHRKSEEAGLSIQWDEGLAFDLPYEDRSFDLVLSSLVLHHLTHDDKFRAMQEVFRVLRPGGEFHVADWGPAQHPLLRAGFFLVQLLDGVATTKDHAAGKIPGMLTDAGFAEVREWDRRPTVFGALCVYRALRPE